MKLYIRLIWTVIAAFFRKRVKPLEGAVTNWRVLPSDLDIFWHMNNARYSMIMDLARVDFLIRLGLLPRVLKNKWVVPVGAAYMDFKGALKPFVKYQVHTKLCYWDDRWFYFRQEFRLENNSNRLVAVGHVKALFQGKKGVVPADTIVESVQGDVLRPELTPELAELFKLNLAKTSAGVSAAVLNQENVREPIAIVGVGCRLPGGVGSSEDLWGILTEGKDCVIDIPSNRWDPKKFHDPDANAPGKAYVHQGGILTQDIYAFDPGFFGISPREAAKLDPMQRLLLEVSWEAFEDAGVDPSSLAGGSTGVFLGGFTIDSLVLHSNPLNREELQSHSAVANGLTMLSNRLSYFYDLRGPSFSLDTACSSSLVAVHQACQSIWSGESENALVGGVNVLLTPEIQVSMSKGKFLSPTGRCHTFDVDADGYVRGEGAALVMLKPLSQAVADGNPIYATIKGTAVNQDGRTKGITVPNGDAQMTAMRKAYAAGGVRPAQISYLEAHGTGTAAGDPVEAKALGGVLSEGRSAQRPCPVGSMKTNIGHTEAVSGVAGLIKAALVLKNRKLVPHLHLNQVNPDIDMEALKLRVPQAVEDLPESGALYAGVNSFGYGGTNAHVVLESPPPMIARMEKEKAAGRLYTLPLSASSEESLSALAGLVADRIESREESLSSICRVLGTRRKDLRIRTWVQGESAEEILKGLRKIARGERRGQEIESGENTEQSKLLFVYTGMGPQWWAMGRELYEKEPVYRAAANECEQIFKEISGWSILDVMGADEADSRITETEMAQPANLVVQVGLTRLLASWGISPDGIVGHSIGEVGAAYAAGTLSLRDSLLVAFHRSRLQARTAGKGGMLAVGLSPDEAREWLVEYPEDKVSVAAVNSPGAVTLAGELETLQVIADRLEAEARFQKFLKVEVPYHSPLMNEIKTDLLAALQGLKANRPNVKLYSTVEGDESQAPQDADYWWRNVREPVLFADSIQKSIEDGFNRFLEIGPHPVLAASIQESLKESGATGVTVPSLVRKESETGTMARALGRLFVHGRKFARDEYFGKGAHVALPLYPFNRKVYWSESEGSRAYRLPNDGHPMVSSVLQNPELAWLVELNGVALPYVADHIVGGNVLFPGAGYVELGLAMASELTKEEFTTLEDIEFLLPATIAKGESPRLTVKPDEEEQSLRFYFANGLEQGVLSSRSRYFSGGKAPLAQELNVLRGTFTESQTVSELYENLAKRGLTYGPAFQPVQSIQLKDDEVLAEIRLPEAIEAEGYKLHPILLDGALHSLIAGDSTPAEDCDVVPTGIRRLQVFGPVGRAITAHGRIVRRTEKEIIGDIDMYDASGLAVARLSGLRCALLPRANAAFESKLEKWTSVKTWETLIPEESVGAGYPGAPAGKWILFPNPMQDEKTKVHFLKSLDRPDIFQVPENWGLEEILDYINAHEGPLRFVDLRWFDLDVTRDESQDLIEQGIDAANVLLETIQKLSTRELDRYYLLTRDAEAVLEHESPNLALAPLLGITRTAMTERPDLNLTWVDLDREFETALDLINFLRKIGPEQEVALRDESILTVRLESRTLEQKAGEELTVPAAEVEAFAMELGEGGRLDTIGYREVKRRRPIGREVEVEMEVSSVHFKDLMKAMGILSSAAEAGTYFAGLIGMEGTGVVTAMGPEVSDFELGDRVYAMGDTMQSHVILDTLRPVKLDDSMSFVDGANLVTYFTVYHALVETARLSRGETLLIHSAAGGVGLAAVNLARWLGANVIVTAGTPEKRKYLRDMGLEQVSDSRTLGFVEDVQEWTQGRGVDVVLNFTPGEVMAKSVHCLAPFGRFIELGKVSFDKNEALRLRPFNENLTYASVDFDRITKQRPEYIQEMCGKVLDLLVRGELKPLPCEVFPAAQTPEAFRKMAAAQHIGKLAISLKDPELKVRPMGGVSRFKPEATYMITGGLAGFGLQVAEWMASQGAKNLALLSRSGAKTPESRAFLAGMRELGVNATAFAVDVSNETALEAAFAEMQGSMPPLAGVFHGAMVLDDRPIQEMDREAIEKVMAPKARGAWNLHRLTASMELDFMVFFSSISALIGNGGQANYVAANNFLDQLAGFRRIMGRKTLSINWGVFQETGVVARNEHLATHLENIGITPFSNQDALNALGAALDYEDAQLAIIHVDWNRFADLLPEGAGAERFKNLRVLSSDAEGGLSDSLLRTQFGELDREERHLKILNGLKSSVAQVMRMDEKDVQSARPLMELGVDSLMSLEITREFTARTGLEIPAMEMVTGPSISLLSDSLLNKLENKLPITEDKPAA